MRKNKHESVTFREQDVLIILSQNKLAVKHIFPCTHDQKYTS